MKGQWENEIHRRCKRNTLAVVIFHGADRHKLAAKLHQYDVVITTYQVFYTSSFNYLLNIKSNLFRF